MPDNSSLDIIVPCYNPELNWEKLVIQAFTKLKEIKRDLNIGLILVNDGSETDISSGLDTLKNTLENRFTTSAIQEIRVKAMQSAGEFTLRMPIL